MVRKNRLSVYFIIGIIVAVMLGAIYMPGGAEAQNQRSLSLGKVGGDVRQLQRELHQRGYNLEPFDGIYGLRTQEAVLDLQKKKGIKANGVFDKRTKDFLDEKVSNELEVSPKGNIDNRGIEKEVSRGLSRQDVMMLARVVHGEARGESFEGQVAVAAVILNRTRSEDFPNTINGVVYQHRAFDAVADGQIWLDPDEKSIKAAQLASEGYDPTNKSLYYWNPAKSTNKWIWSRPIVKKIGEHVFAK